jgi:hypothetical protein
MEADNLFNESDEWEIIFEKINRTETDTKKKKKQQKLQKRQNVDMIKL